MSTTVIRDGNGHVKYKLQENRLYNTTTVRDSSGTKISSYSNKEKSLKTTTEKLRHK